MNNTTVAINLLLGLLDRAHAIGALLSRAKAEGRDISNTELDQLVLDDDNARDALQDAIDKAKRA